MNITRQSLLLGMSLILAAQGATVLAQPGAPPVAFVQASNVACKVGRPNVKAGETVAWQGQCADGFANGAGVAQWSQDGKPTLRFEGTFIRGLLEGKGKMIGADGDLYEGEYKGGLRHGHGVYVTGNGTRFEGEYVNNQRGAASAAAAVPPTPPAPPAQVAQAPAPTSPPPVAPTLKAPPASPQTPSTPPQIAQAPTPSAPAQSGRAERLPTEANGRAVLERTSAPSIRDGTMKIESFTKTNGQRANVGGVDSYILEYSAEISYPKGLMSQCVGAAGSNQFSFECFNALSNRVQPKKVGQKDTVNGRLQFQTTERGWRGPDGNIY